MLVFKTVLPDTNNLMIRELFAASYNTKKAEPRAGERRRGYRVAPARAPAAARSGTGGPMSAQTNGCLSTWRTNLVESQFGEFTDGFLGRWGGTACNCAKSRTEHPTLEMAGLRI